ncbi:MAG TPA: SpoIIE family protein phosphatase [Bryobacteraceae bacterium]|nr:SpoIIE family protein phosphatase [Bryobacteraceae bacterium]
MLASPNSMMMATAADSTTPLASASRQRLRVLVSDDQADVREALRLLLKGAGYATETVDSPAAVLRAVASELFDLILMDLNYTRDTTSGQEGLDLLEQLSARQEIPPVVVMTAWGNVDLAVAAMQRGATDFVQKPWDNARLLSTIEKQARAAAQRASAERDVRSELEIARNVQQKLFPQSIRQLATIRVAARCTPAREVSGDYYDFLETGADSMGFVLADVSGKGIGAALLMASLQSAFRSQVEIHPHNVPALLHAVNRLFHESTPPEHYATAFYAEYDDRSRELTFVNCGHPPALLLHGGQVERLHSTATVLGLFPEYRCTANSVRLAPGDMLLVYSDGVTEAGINGGEELGEDRLAEMLLSSGPLGVEAALEQICQRVHCWAAVAHDDRTILLIGAV